MSHPVIHFEFGGPDGAGLADFYGRLFGWEVQPSGPEYWLLSPGGGSLAGGVLQTSGGIPPYFTIYVAVDDLEQAMAQAEGLGASAIVQPTTVPGVGTFAMFRDPAGNMVGMMVQNAAAAGLEGGAS
jgi:predicted enzyme related to lactoylglutathione lyase